MFLVKGSETVYGVKAQFLGNTGPRGDAMEYLIVLMVVVLIVIAMLFMKSSWLKARIGPFTCATYAMNIIANVFGNNAAKW